MPAPESNDLILLKLPEVMRRVGLSRPSVYKRMKAHGQFPRPVYPAKRAPRWRSDEIAAWIERLSATRSAAPDQAGRSAGRLSTNTKAPTVVKTAGALRIVPVAKMIEEPDGVYHGCAC